MFGRRKTATPEIDPDIRALLERSMALLSQVQQERDTALQQLDDVMAFCTSRQELLDQACITIERQNPIVEVAGEFWSFCRNFANTPGRFKIVGENPVWTDAFNNLFNRFGDALRQAAVSEPEQQS